jgi:Kef-type K+ transport system membrane component KefB
MPNIFLLLIQVAVILAATKAAGWLMRFLGQPPVVGELAAGILLGPSLFGWLAPDLFTALFPPASFGFLQTLSQIGLLLYMFIVGLEFSPRGLRRHGPILFLASHFSISLIMALVSVVSFFLFAKLSDSSVNFLEFTLFLGVALGITAFPVLARIIRERHISKTLLGSFAIGCAAVDDVTAWMLLAYVLGLVHSIQSSTSVAGIFAGLTAYVVLMVTVVRKSMKVVVTGERWRGPGSEMMLSLVLLLLLASAATTEWLGIHIVFGAFLFGAIVPREGGVAEDLEHKLAPVTETLLLPILYAVIGLRTSVGSLRGNEMWMYLGVLLLTALAGKLGGVTLAARAFGVPWRSAFAFGTLMNTRGLMELVIAKIGLDLGIINQAVFSMLVLIALITTAVTSPVLALIYSPSRLREEFLREKSGEASAAAHAGAL